ncbi:MAG TPA: hypothetical protein VLT36_26620 [Candidatus Dormibacteraeota bacterium]|nr:hypothetical protein [Candidatus Dormibacteraeota bacterium]
MSIERGQLGQNLRELQSKVEQTTDWRLQFRKRPMAFIGAAFGGGLLLALMTGGRCRSGRR